MALSTPRQLLHHVGHRPATGELKIFVARRLMEAPLQEQDFSASKIIYDISMIPRNANIFSSGVY